MYETAKERVRLLKAGISGKTIEGMYVFGNDMKIIKGNVLHTEETCGHVPNDKQN